MAGILVLCLACEGCNRFQHHPPVIVDAPPALWDNPMFVPVTDPEFVWNQLVDTLDDYFAIQKEERVRPIGNTLTEGRIETQPQIGATYLEPWRRDSMPGFERLQSTLQSIRRRATVRVIPSEGGYLIEVVVAKELEDVDRPEFYTIQGPSFRHDGSQVRGTERDRIGPVTLGWIALGRDIELEQRILQDVQARVAQPPSRMHP